jgi:hypothetical protein
MSFGSNGIRQFASDLYLQSEGALGSDTFSFVGRTEIDPPVIPDLIGNAINIVFIGQSTNNNAINATLIPYVATNPHNIYNGNIANPTPASSLFYAKEPLLCSDLDCGHHGMNLADSLVSAGVAQNVVLWLASFGGSFTGNFVPNGEGRSGTVTEQPDYLSWRLGLVYRAMASMGLDANPTYIDYQHGEWDTDAATTEANVTNNILKTVERCKYWGLLRRGNGAFYVNLNTRISGLQASRDAVRDGEEGATDGDLVRLGADIDTLPADPYRYDGTHFNTEGAAAQAALKVPLVTDFLENG